MPVLVLGVDLLPAFFFFFLRRRYSCFISRGKHFQSCEHKSLLNISFQGFKSQCLLELPLLEVYIKECCLLRRAPKSPKTWLWKEVCSSKCKYCCPLKLEALRVIYGRKIAMWRKDFITLGGEKLRNSGISTILRNPVILWIQLRLDEVWPCNCSCSVLPFAVTKAVFSHTPAWSSCWEQLFGTLLVGLCCGTAAGSKILFIVSKVVPSQLLWGTGGVFFLSLWNRELKFR